MLLVVNYLTAGFALCRARFAGFVGRSGSICIRRRSIDTRATLVTIRLLWDFPSP